MNHAPMMVNGHTALGNNISCIQTYLGPGGAMARKPRQRYIKLARRGIRKIETRAWHAEVRDELDAPKGFDPLYDVSPVAQSEFLAFWSNDPDQFDMDGFDDAGNERDLAQTMFALRPYDIACPCGDPYCDMGDLA